MTMTRSYARCAALLLGVLATAAWKDGARRHTSDGDTGAAAPATVRDLSATPHVPDSGHPPTGVARSDSVRPRGTDVPATLTTKPAGTPAIKPPGTP
jgi:hypothetical protein